MPEESKFEMTQWCNEHDLPMRAVRTVDDRIVCWFVWWVEHPLRGRSRFPEKGQGQGQGQGQMDAMDRRPPGVSLEEISVPILPCDPSFRVLLTQGFAAALVEPDPDGPIE